MHPAVADTAVLRALDLLGGRAFPAEIAGEGGFVLSSLRRWGDDYGAVAENENGEWRLCYSPQWLRGGDLFFPGARILEETESTNDDARGLPPPAFVFAEHQTAGRGRRGREWFSLPGASVLFSAHLPKPGRLSGLTVAVAVGLLRALKQFANARLKWPNDLLDERGRKVGGVLASATNSGVVVGVGINLHLTHRLARRIGRPAAGLDEIADDLPPRGVLTNAFARAAQNAVEEFAGDGLAPFLPDAIDAHFPSVGSQLTVTDTGKGGVFAGFAEDGALLLQSGGRVTRHLCGEVCGVAGS